MCRLLSPGSSGPERARRGGLGQPVIVLMVVMEMCTHAAMPAWAAVAMFSEAVKRWAHIRLAILAKAQPLAMAKVENGFVEMTKSNTYF